MPKYLKPDTEKGYIENSAEIEYLKFNNLRHTILGYMLGDFDESGRYVVSSGIRTELIAMKKHIADSVDNIDICVGQLKLNKNISFSVVFEENKAVLYLLEKINYQANFKINSGSYSDINEYVLDSIETSGVIDRNVVYARWNISTFPVQSISILDCDEATLAEFFNIANRFKYLLQANNVFLKKESEIENAESNYALQMFELMKKYPELEKSFMEEFKKVMGEKKELISPDKPNYAKTLNEVLDQILLGSLSKLDENAQKQFMIERQAILMKTNIERAELLDTEKTSIQIGTEIVGVSHLIIDEFLEESLVDIAKIYLEEVKNFKLLQKKNKEDLIQMLLLWGVIFKEEKKEESAGLIAKEVGADAKKEEKKADAKKPEAKKEEKKADTKKPDKKPEKKPDKKPEKKVEAKKVETKTATKAQSGGLPWYINLTPSQKQAIQNAQTVSNNDSNETQSKILKEIKHGKLGTGNVNVNGNVNLIDKKDFAVGTAGVEIDISNNT